MEEKIKLTCDLCEGRYRCTARCTPVCADFTLDKDAIEALIKKTTKTTGLTWEEAEKEALKGHCICRKAWGKEAFVWRRDMKTLSPDTNDPYVREACRRTGSHTLAEGACFAKLDYDSRYKGLPRVILHWMPTDENDLNATDWEVFDVPVTYEDHEVNVMSPLEHVLRHPGEYTYHEVCSLMKGIFPEKVKDHEEEIASKVKCAFRRRMGLKRNFESIFGKMDEINGIMDDLDDLLK